MSHKKRSYFLKISLLILIIPALACQAITQAVAPPTNTPTRLPTHTPPPTFTPLPPTPDLALQRQEYLSTFEDTYLEWYDAWEAWRKVDDRVEDEPNATLFEDELFKQQLAESLVMLENIANKIDALPEPTDDLALLDLHFTDMGTYSRIMSETYLDAITGDEEAEKLFLEALGNLVDAVEATDVEVQKLYSD